MSGVNKIIFGDETLLDISEDTVSPYRLLKGYKAHTADGTQVDGLYDPNATSILTTRKITVNGTYEAADDRALGYSEVTVNVPGTFYKRLIEKNGTYKAEDEDIDGFSQIRVDTEEVEPWDYTTTIDEVVQERNLDFVSTAYGILIPPKPDDSNTSIRTIVPPFSHGNNLYLIYATYTYDYEQGNEYYNNIVYVKDVSSNVVLNFEKIGEYAGPNRSLSTIFATYHNNKIHIIAEDKSTNPISLKHYSLNNNFELTEESNLPYDVYVSAGSGTYPRYKSMISYNNELHISGYFYNESTETFFNKHYAWDGTNWNEASQPIQSTQSRYEDQSVRLFVGGGLNCVSDNGGYVWKYDESTDTWNIINFLLLLDTYIPSSIVYHSIPNEYDIYLGLYQRSNGSFMIGFNSVFDSNIQFNFYKNEDISTNCKYYGIAVGSSVFFIPNEYNTRTILSVKHIDWNSGENVGWVNTGLNYQHQLTGMGTRGWLMFNDKLYVSGSYSNNIDDRRSIYEIDLLRNTKRLYTTIPIELYSSSTSLYNMLECRGSFHFFIDDASHNARHLSFDGSNWTIDVSSLPFGWFTMSNCIMVTCNNQIHVMGGDFNGDNSDPNNYKCHYYYDGNVWNTGESLPCQNYYSGQGNVIAYNGVIHIMGFTKPADRGKHYKYENGTWVFVEDLPTSLYPGGTSAIILYYLGIYNGKISAFKNTRQGYVKNIDVYSFDEDTSTWSIVNTYENILKYYSESFQWFYQLDGETLFLEDQLVQATQSQQRYWYLTKSVNIGAYPNKYEKKVYKLLQDSQEES